MVAARAGPGDRLRPEGVLAVREAVAGVEDLAAPGALLVDLPLAALGAGDAGGLGLGPLLLGRLADVLALGVGRAAVEGAVAAAPEDHGRAALLARRHLVGRRHALLGLRLGPLGLEVPGVLAVGVARAAVEQAETAALHEQLALAALRAGLARGDAVALDVGHRLAGGLEVLRELLVEATQGLLPREAPLLDPVELLLELGGVALVDDVVEVALEHPVDELAQGGGGEALLDAVHVVPVGQGGEDLGIGRGAADAVLLQGLDQGGLAVAGRRLGELLLAVELDELELLALPDLRHGGALAVLGLVPGRRVLVLRLLVDRQEAGALQDLAPGPEQVAAVLHVHLGDVEERRLHLRGDEAVPDELVELEFFGFEVFLRFLGRQVEVRGADRLVGVLGPLLRAVAHRLARQRLLAVGGAHVLPGLLQGFLAHPGGVGPHVGDETDRAPVADLLALVEPLGDPHGALDREAVAPGGVLLEAAGDEGRSRVLLGLLALDGGDPEAAGAQGLDDGGRLLLVLDLRALAVDPVELGGEHRRLGGLEVGGEVPVLLRHEGVDLLLPVADHLQRHRLDPAGRETLLDLLPQERRQPEAHQPVEDAPGLLGVHLALVDPPGLLERPEHRPLGDLVEGHPVDLLRVLPEDLGDVPGDGLAFAVRVGGEEDPVGLLRRLPQAADDLLLLIEHLVVGLEVGSDPHVLLDEVADVAHGGLHPVSAPQELLQGPGLGGALDDDQVLAHGPGKAVRLRSYSSGPHHALLT